MSFFLHKTYVFQVKDENGGFYYDEAAEQCENCMKWEYQKKSCDKKNALAKSAICILNDTVTLDPNCYKKTISKGI